MAEDRLTEAFVEAATCPAGRKDRLIFDRDLPGFGLRVGANGSKVFVVQYSYGGRKRRMPIGSFGVVTPDKARRQAKAVLGQAAAGHDPYAKRKTEAAESRAKEAAERAAAAEEAYTVRHLIRDWQEAREGERRASYLALASAALKRHFKEWLDRPASSVTTVEAVRELDRIKREVGGTAANRALSYGRAAYSWAVKRQAMPANPFAGIEAPSREKPRDHVLSAEELGAIWRAAPSAITPYGDFIRVLMLLLARRDEVSAMRWDELSPDLTTWALPRERSKNDKAHIVHLAEPVRAILAARTRRKSCPFVFPAASGRPITSFSYAKKQISAAMAAAHAKDATQALPEGWTLHDFRRAGVTALAGMGFAPHVCDRLLNHITGAISGVAAVYQRAEFLPERKAALEAWAAHVVAAGEGKPSADNVVTLRS